jgi:hypothetical protein
VREWFDRNGLEGVLSGNVLENLRRRERATVLRWTSIVVQILKGEGKYLIIADEPAPWRLIVLVIGDHDVVSSYL